LSILCDRPSRDLQAVLAEFFDQMVGNEVTVNTNRYEQPVVSYTKVETARRQAISQLAEPSRMLTITAADVMRTIPTESIGLEISDQALQATTLDLVGLSLRRLRLIKPHRGPGKIALAAHWENVQFPHDYCYMHISSPGYTGMAPVGNDSVNVVLVVEDRQLKGQEMDAFYQRVVWRNERRQSLLAGARLNLTDAFQKVLHCGLDLLGIEPPEKM